jgi:RNA polymerase sigma-70 factor (ECF subfamily)
MLAGSTVALGKRRSGSSIRATFQRAGSRSNAMKKPSPDEDVFDASELICAVARQDKEAFGRLFEHFAPRIKAMLMRKGLAEHRAEDLAQETMLMVWRKANKFNPEGANAAAWIFTIARNRQIDRVRQEKHDIQGAEALIEDASDESPLADAVLAASQDRERLRDALDGLSREQLTVVRLSFFEDRPHSEIAEVLSIPIGTVKSRLRLAMGRLRDLLDDTQ